MVVLEEIGQSEPGVVLDLAYARTDNFTGRPVYAHAHCLLHPAATARLRDATRQARALGLLIRVFDAFRPVEAQWCLWRHTPDPAFVARPWIGSPHSRGVAVDLTLADGSGEPLDMGTPFDDFTPASCHGSIDISPAARRNRLLLLGLMTGAGWRHYENEWWHYQLPESRTYPLLSDSAAPRRLMAAGTRGAGAELDRRGVGG